MASEEASHVAAGLRCLSLMRRKAPTNSLAGKKVLVIGIANEDSRAFGCAKAFRAQGADLAPHLSEPQNEPVRAPIAEKLKTDIIQPLDVIITFYQVYAARVTRAINRKSNLPVICRRN
jgi:enoyl-[acyl-carrier-protein] reductase (NADH)